MLTFSADDVIVVEFHAPEPPAEYASLSARQLTDLYRTAQGSETQRRIADAIHAVHVLHGEYLVRWLQEEEEYEERVSANCPFLGADYRRWLGHVRAEIDAVLTVLEEV